MNAFNERPLNLDDVPESGGALTFDLMEMIGDHQSQPADM